MTNWIIIALYWIVSCIFIYAIRNKNRKKPLNRFLKKETKLWEHLLIILLAPIALPIILLILCFKVYHKWYYKNRPRPLSKKIKKYMKKDRVLDEKNNIVSLADYNYQHGTEYTLDDVYGKGYMDSLNDDEKSAATTESTKYLLLEIQENIPNTLHTEASKALASALLSGDFAVFENLLDDNAENICYQKETISGKVQVVDFWRGWRSRYVETRKAKKFEVVYSNYYSNACLLLEMMVVMFFIRDKKIKKVLLIQRNLNPTIGYQDDMLEFPFDLDSIKHCLSDLREPNEVFEPVVRENRIPCFSCGTPSEKLEWHSSLFQTGDVGYSGIVSVCPHCHKVVEYYPEMRIRYNEPIDPREAIFPIPRRWEKTDYNPRQILEKEGDSSYNEEKLAFKDAKSFLAYIEEGNIFASKAKAYHWRIKTNLNSLKMKGNDAVSYDLDALSLEAGYHMGLRIAGQQGKGDESNF